MFLLSGRLAIACAMRLISALADRNAKRTISGAKFPALVQKMASLGCRPSCTLVAESFVKTDDSVQVSQQIIGAGGGVRLGMHRTKRSEAQQCTKKRRR
jgi:hypothetical protein